MTRRRTVRGLCASVTLATALGMVGGLAPATAEVAPSVRPALTTTTPVVKMGMSAPRDEWSARLAEVGGVDARRIFSDLASPDGALKIAVTEVAAGRMPVLSFKVPGNDWSGAAAGKYDAALKALTAKLDALPGRVFVTLHHEPVGDGTATDYAAMQRRVLPILGAPSNVDAGVIVNGFWWSAGAQGYTDAEIAQWLPASVLRVAEVVAADTYQGGTPTQPGEYAAVKIRRMSQWATRTGVKRLGLGEYNGLNGAAIKAAGAAVLEDPRFSFACIFNSNVNNREGIDWTLTGERLTAFRATVKEARLRAAIGARAQGTSSLTR